MPDVNLNNIIGIPRALSYYNNYPFYYGFFTSLGIKIILSEKTTSKIINQGSQVVVSETCLPVKVFAGHVIDLLEKGCNKIFVPSLQSTGYKINNCSKIRGLAEIIRNVINTDFIMVEPTLDKTEKIGLKDFCYQIAAYYNITDKERIDNAIKGGWKVYNKFIELAMQGNCCNEALACSINDSKPVYKFKPKKQISVALMAHGYNLFDERISLNLIKKLEKMNVQVYTSLDVERKKAVEAVIRLGEVQYWANELELTGTAANYLLTNGVDGIIALSAFGCGPDSLMVEEISYHCREKGMPLIHLTIDEHTGEAGFVTRLEAFIDMLIRKKQMLYRKTNNVLVLENKCLTQKEAAGSIY